MSSPLVEDVARSGAWARRTRRPVCHLLAAGIAAALGHVRVIGVIAAQCRKKSDRCDNGAQCCSGRCKRGFCYPRR